MKDRLKKYLVDRLGVDNSGSPMLLRGIRNKLDRIKNIQVFVFGRSIGGDELDGLNCDPEMSYFATQSDVATCSSDSLFLEYLREKYPLNRMVRIYFNDSQRFLSWPRIFNGDDKALYGEFDILNDSLVSEFINGASDFAHLGGIFPCSKNRDNLSNPNAAFITVFDNEGILLIEFE